MVDVFVVGEVVDDGRGVSARQNVGAPNRELSAANDGVREDGSFVRVHPCC